jgi:hypothetical protein
LNPIDVVLKRTAVTEGLSLFFVPDLPGCSFQGGISKRIPPKVCSELIFKGLLLRNPWQNFPLLIRKGLSNP